MEALFIMKTKKTKQKISRKAKSSFDGRTGWTNNLGYYTAVNINELQINTAAKMNL